TADADPVLGDPDLSRREDRQIAGEYPVGAGADLSMDDRGRQRHGADRAEHLLSRQPHAGEGAGLGDQILRGPARRPIPRRGPAACRVALSDRPRDHDRRYRRLPDLCRAQGADRRRRLEERHRLGRAGRLPARRAEGHEARSLSRSQTRVMTSLSRLAAGLAVLLVAAATAAAAERPAPWVEFAADGTLSVRTILAPGT